MIDLKILKCVDCKKSKILKFNDKKLICNCCKKKYNYSNLIVSIIKKNFLKKQEWNAHDSKDLLVMGKTYYKRSLGELPEKEASKSFARVILKNNLLKKNQSILDYGCATGHFYNSFKRLFPFEFEYYGIDAVESFLKLGEKAYSNNKKINFIHGDVLNIPIKKKTFDISVVNLFHFFPDIYRCLKESKRVTKKYIIWRTPIANLNYCVKIFHKNNKSVSKPLSFNLDDKDEYTINIFYSMIYLKRIFKKLNLKVVYFKKDNDFKSFDNTNISPKLGGTKTINNTQIDGIMVMNWHYIILKIN